MFSVEISEFDMVWSSAFRVEISGEVSFCKGDRRLNMKLSC